MRLSDPEAMQRVRQAQPDIEVGDFTTGKEMAELMKQHKGYGNRWVSRRTGSCCLVPRDEPRRTCFPPPLPSPPRGISAPVGLLRR
jgi:hypothetical protein